ncbi:hypothetical protein V8G54_003014 [Vigna mungo]|uniref:Uncharacterized protein n=1 Tax=Vigna mungo TaxID=3915 RepID=A0AAQ3PC80_VIGMU
MHGNWMDAAMLWGTNSLEDHVETIVARHKSEYVIYKLKEMGKVSEKDVMQLSVDIEEGSREGSVRFSSFGWLGGDIRVIESYKLQLVLVLLHPHGWKFIIIIIIIIKDKEGDKSSYLKNKHHTC